MRIANAVFWLLVFLFAVRSLPREGLWIASNAVFCCLLCFLTDRLLQRSRPSGGG